MTLENRDTFKKNRRSKRQTLCDVILYTVFSPFIIMIALPVIVAGIAEIVIKKIDPEYFNR